MTKSYSIFIDMKNRFSCQNLIHKIDILHIKKKTPSLLCIRQQVWLLPASFIFSYYFHLHTVIIISLCRSNFPFFLILSFDQFHVYILEYSQSNEERIDLYISGMKLELFTLKIVNKCWELLFYIITISLSFSIDAHVPLMSSTSCFLFSLTTHAPIACESFSWAIYTERRAKESKSFVIFSSFIFFSLQKISC